MAPRPRSRPGADSSSTRGDGRSTPSAPGALLPLHLVDLAESPGDTKLLCSEAAEKAAGRGGALGPKREELDPQAAPPPASQVTFICINYLTVQNLDFHF